jgi:ADP-ribosylglycohydrolase
MTHRFLASDAGVLVGTALGDALGAPFETLPASDSRLQAWDGQLARTHRDGEVWPAGTTTDDTAMAAALAQALDEVRDRYDAAAAARRYLAWYRTGARGIGGTTRKAMENLAAGLPPDRSGIPCEPGRTGNGPAMRVAPIGLRFAFDRAARIAAAREDARITHLGEDAEAGAVAVAEAVAAAARGFDPILILARAISGVCDVIDFGRFPAGSSVHRHLARALDEFSASPGITTSTIDASGEIGATVATAILCAARHPDDLVGAVRAAVRHGGDTDTRAAITGAIVCARVGSGAIPLRDWRVLSRAAPATDGHDPTTLEILDAHLRGLAPGDTPAAGDLSSLAATLPSLADVARLLREWTFRTPGRYQHATILATDLYEAHAGGLAEVAARERALVRVASAGYVRIRLAAADEALPPPADPQELCKALEEAREASRTVKESPGARVEKVFASLSDGGNLRPVFRWEPGWQMAIDGLFRWAREVHGPVDDGWRPAW